jgi:hypothetical protein
LFNIASIPSLWGLGEAALAGEGLIGGGLAGSAVQATERLLNVI